MLYAMLLPGFVYLIVFKYIPLGGLVIAFQNYNPFLGLTESPFVGLKHFIFLFSGSDFKKLMVNTLWISVLNLIFYFPMPIITARICCLFFNIHTITATNTRMCFTVPISC